MKINIFSKLIFAMLFAFTVNSFVYFGFGNIYSSKILNYAEFQNQFANGIYQYRILSGYFLVWVYEFLGSLNLNYDIFKLKFLNPASEPQMYLSFYVLNTFFSVLCAAIMVLISEQKNFLATESEKILITAIGIFTIALTQFVIVPYDNSTYFFFLLFFYFLINYLNRGSNYLLIILVVIMAVSTLNRESSALSISLAATLLLSKFGIKKQTLLPIAILTFTFIAVYVGMRLASESFSTNDGNLLAENFTQPKNFLGMLFWFVFFVFTLMISIGNEQRKMILIFHLLAIPYILMSFYTGILYEARLYVPLFLGGLVLSRHHKTSFKKV